MGWDDISPIQKCPQHPGAGNTMWTGHIVNAKGVIVLKNENILIFSCQNAFTVA